MADKKTRFAKIQSEVRNLKQVNENLRIENDMLKTKMAEISKCEKKRVGSSTIKKSIFLYTYDIIISALILAFVYWIAINGVESFDVLFIIFLTLFVLVMIKCLFDNKELRIRPIIGIILNDLIKPVMSMITGLFLCILCLGDSWKGAKNYALDTANTVILIVSITGLVSMIVIASYLVLGVIKLLVRKVK